MNRIEIKRGFSLLLFGMMLVVIGFIATGSAFSADPDSGTLTNAEPLLEYTAGPFLTANPTPQIGVSCDAPFECDEYELTIAVDPGTDATHDVKVTVSWGVSGADFDIYIYDENDDEIASAASSSNPEIMVIPPVNGVYRIVTVPFAPAGQSIDAKIELVPKSVTANPGPLPVQFPRYHNYVAPADLGNSAGEPTLGVNHNNNAVMYVAGLETLRVHFDDDYDVLGNSVCSAPVKEVWVDKSYDAHVTTLDPILFTDAVTGRTFSSQLSAKSNLLGISDDDGDSWTPSQGSATLQSGVDHQTMTSGPYSDGFDFSNPLLYPHAVYYCGQDIAYANCARSDDGGLTFAAAVPIYNLTECGGLHGHLRIAPNDGTVYMPNKGCGGNQAVVVSEDSGLTWTVRPVPDSVASATDPGVGIGADGRVYFGYVSGNSTPTVAVSDDKGASWTTRDLTANLPAGTINTAVWAKVIAGDNDRAAVTFIGTDRVGHNSSGDADRKPDGEWYVYVSHTYDGGNTWHTINVTPNDPVQRGTICTSGTTCGGDRNLLDFYDIQVDRVGRTLIGYADGCIGNCVVEGPNSFSDKAKIARQEGGLGLYSAFDTSGLEEATAPSAPRVDSVVQGANGDVTLTYTLADNGGSEITSYNIYRREEGGAFIKINSEPVVKTSYVDSTTVDGVNYLYQVTAENAIGESAGCEEYALGDIVPPTDVCQLPGTIVSIDGAGDAPLGVGGRDDADLLFVAVAELFNANNPTAENFIFTMQVTSLLTPDPLTEWTTFFTYNGVTYYVDASNLATGSGTYEYGTLVLQDNDNFFDKTVLGSADSGSFTATGTISIIVSKDKFTTAGSTPASGDQLTNVDARVIEEAPLRLFLDRATPADYTVRSNLACAPNIEPTAELSVTPLEGESPLEITIDASGSSDPDDGDSVALYRVEIAPTGEVITSTTPIIMTTLSHTLTQTVEFRVTLTVEDTFGAVSLNSPTADIEVRPEGGVPTALAVSTLNAGGGNVMVWLGLGLIVLLTGGMVATVVMRKRRLSL